MQAAQTFNAEAFKVTEDIIDLKKAHQAYAGVSFDPEKRAQQVRQEFVSTTNALIEHLFTCAKNEKQLYYLADQLPGFIEKLTARYTSWLTAKANVLSPMITGPSGFNSRRNEKANRTEDRRWEDYTHLKNAFRSKMLKALSGLKAPEQKHEEFWDSVRKNILSHAETIFGIDAGTEPYTRTLIQNGIYGPLKTMHRNGKYSLVNKALEYIRELSKHPQAIKPLFTDRHAIWKLETAYADAEQQQQEAIKEEAEETVMYQSEALTVVNNRPEARVQFLFDGKPDAKVIDVMKRNAYRWSPRFKAWQRQNTLNGLHNAKQLIEILKRANFA